MIFCGKKILFKVENRPPWYFPYSMIKLSMFGVELDDLLHELDSLNRFVDIYQLITVATRLGRGISVNFKKREVEALKLIATERNVTSTGIISFEELANLLGVSRPVAKDYWLNLYKFFHIGINIHHGKLGLFPVLVKHGRELTQLEKQYTRLSFYKDHSYSLLYIPLESSWVEENDKADEQFSKLGTVNRLVDRWNLTHFTGKSSRRWGNYPGLDREDSPLGLIKKSDIKVFDRNKRVIDGLQARDFEILNVLSHSVGRQKEASDYLNISESYYSKRILFLAKHSVFSSKVSFNSCGLDLEVLLVLHAGRKSNENILEEVMTALAFFPHEFTFIGENCLLTKIMMPSRWLRDFLIEIECLTEPGGYWHENSIVAVTHVYRSRTTINNLLTNLNELVIQSEQGIGQRLKIEWSFEQPWKGRI